jgi:hypothetical protein
MNRTCLFQLPPVRKIVSLSIFMMFLVLTNCASERHDEVRVITDLSSTNVVKQKEAVRKAPIASYLRMRFPGRAK